MRMVSKKAINLVVQDDQAVLEGQVKNTLEADMFKKAVGMRVVSEEDHSRVDIEPSNWMIEDDLTEFKEDDSREILAENTLSTLDNEQSCLENGVTNPVTTKEVKSTGLPVSTTDLPIPARVVVSTGLPATLEERISPT